MANGHRKGLFRSPAVLFVAFVTLLGLTGLVTAFWFTETTIEGNVQTGNVGLQWWSAGTDDDGFIGNDSSGSDADQTCGGPAEAWDAHEADGCEDPDTQYFGSSADPAEPYPYGGNQILERYDKDVGRCWAEPQGDRLAFYVENGYPSYHCTVEGQLVGGGGVPVMTAGVTLGDFVKYTNFGWEGPGGPYEGPVCYDEGQDLYWIDEAEDWDGDCSPGYDETVHTVVAQTSDQVSMAVEEENGYLKVSRGGEHELTLWIHDSCGAQVDPYFGEGEPEDIATYKVSVHVEELADPDSQYVMYLYPRGVNWNEFGDLDPQCGIFGLD